MKAGSFKLNDYLERLHEEKEVSSKVPVEGLIIPEENKRSFAWLKKEYQKGKTEVKVEMKLGGSKFEPGYDMQTNLKSVNDFKPGMFGDVKTSDTEGSKKKEEGHKEEEEGTEGKSKGFRGKAVHKKFVGVKGVETEEKEEEKEEKEEEKGEVKKKLEEGLEIVQQGEPLDREASAYLSELPMSRKPTLDDLYYVHKIQVDPQLEAILSLLTVIDLDTYEDLLQEFDNSVPKTFFIANILEEDGVSFLIDPSGYNYARYIAELI
jgi:hypothetical protein